MMKYKRDDIVNFNQVFAAHSRACIIACDIRLRQAEGIIRCRQACICGRCQKAGSRRNHELDAVRDRVWLTISDYLGGKAVMKVRVLLATLMIVVACSRAAADTTDAACAVYPPGEDHTDILIPCTFSQRQGFITIERSDGVTHSLSPSDGAPGAFTDGDGHAAYRQSGLGDQGLIFRLAGETVYA